MVILRFRVGGVNNRMITVVGATRHAVERQLRTWGFEPQHTCWFDGDGTILESTGSGQWADTPESREMRQLPGYEIVHVVLR
jgi:hypothetical protein